MRIANLPPLSLPAWIAACTLLFAFGLSIPKVVSISALLLIGLSMANGMLACINIGYYWRLFLLSLFAALHYATLILHQHAALFDMVKLPIIFAGLYAAGYTLARGTTENNANRTAWLLLSLALGFASYGFGSVVYTGFPMNTTFLPGANSLWQDGVLHKTMIGVFSSMGMCLLPAAFTSQTGPNRGRLWTVTCLCVATAGFASNLALQNRTPLLSMGAAVVIGGWIVLRERMSRGISLKSVVQWGSAGTLVAAVSLVALIQFFPLLMDTVFLRFRMMGGLHSTRFDVWMTMFEHLFDNPFGGHQIVLVENYAHNVWLDAVLDVGLPIALLLLVFHLSHVPALITCVLKLPFLRLRVTIAVLGISLAMSFLVEPIMSASAYVFAASCFVLGGVLRLSHELGDVHTAGGAPARLARTTR